MKRSIYVFVLLFLSMSVSGFEMNYTINGEHFDLTDEIRTTDPRHEKITENAIYFLCKEKGKSFINSNLQDFIDVGSISDCEQLKNENTIFSLKRGVRYNDVPEVDGFTAMDYELVDEDGGKIAALCATAMHICPVPALCVGQQAAVAMFCFNLIYIGDISDEVDLSNEKQYPIMHAQLNSHNFFKRPEIFINVIRDYVKSYFYELLSLSLTSSVSEPENMFVSYIDILDNDSTDSGDFLIDVNYRKILLGELLHTIEDSFAHNIRYMDYITDEKSGELEKVIKIGAVLNMGTVNYGNFGHDDDFGPMNWNCKDVDDTANWSSSDQALNIPLNFESLDIRYFEHSGVSGNNSLFPFVKEESASTMASHAVAEFLWRLGKAIKDPNNKTETEDSINEYLKRWFTDGTAIFEPTGQKDVPLEYKEIEEIVSQNPRWDNFYNIDLWKESGIKDRTETGYKVSVLPWIIVGDNDGDFKLNVDYNRRFVVKTFEDNRTHPDCDFNATTAFDNDTKIMNLGRSSFYIFTSWSYHPHNTANIRKVDMTAFSFFDENGNVLEIPIETLPESTAAVFVPRGFKICLFYDYDGVESFDNNDAAKFFKMPTYRCFYGGEKGRLVSSGKEDALKPGTIVMAMPIDGDGDGYFYLNDFDENDNCPKVYNPDQEDNFRPAGFCLRPPCKVINEPDGIGDHCQDSDGDGVLDIDDRCQGSFETDNDGDGVPNGCDYFDLGSNEDLDGDGVPDEHDNCFDSSLFDLNPTDEEINKIKNPLKPVPLKELVFARTRNSDAQKCPGMIEKGCYQTGVLFNGLGMFNVWVEGLNRNTNKILRDLLGRDAAQKLLDGEYDKSNVSSLEDLQAEVHEKCLEPSSDEISEEYPAAEPIESRKECAIDHLAKAIVAGKLNLLWQPDHDLDGIGDKCDSDWAYSRFTKAEPFDEKLGCSETPFGFGSALVCDHNYGDVIEIETEKKGSETAKTRSVGNYYCAAANSSELENWGMPGICTTAWVDFEDKNSNYEKIRPIFDYGYSHGSDPEPVNPDTGKPSWNPISVAYTLSSAQQYYEKVMSEKDLVSMQTYSIVPPSELDLNAFHLKFPASFTPVNGANIVLKQYWNWRADYCINQARNSNECREVINRQQKGTGFTFYYALSSGVLRDTTKPYISHVIQTDLNGNYIGEYKAQTPEFFFNSNIYARSERLNDKYRTVSYSYYESEIPFRIVDEKDYSKVRPGIIGEYLPEAWWNDGRYQIGDMTREMDGAYGVILKGLLSGTLTTAKDELGNVFALVNEENLNGETVHSIYKGSMTDSYDWIKMSEISGFPGNIGSVSSVVIDGSIYFAVKNGDNSNLYGVNFSESDFSAQNFGLIPALDDMRLFQIGESFVLTGSNESGLQVCSYDPETQSITTISLEEIPSYRTAYNITSDGNSLFVSGGLDSGGTPINDFYIIDFTVNDPAWESIPVTLSENTGNMLMKINNGEIIFADIASTVTGNLNLLKISQFDWSISTEKIQLDIVIPVKSEQCRTFVDGVMYPGIISGGVCLPVMIGSEGTFDTGKTNYAVAGIEDVIYVAQGNGFEVFKAKTMTKTGSRSLYGPVKDLVVKGTKLFAAVGNGIDVFDISEKENPVLISHIATYGDTTSFDIEGNDLYVGDGQGIKAYDTETLALKKQKNTSGDTEALEYFNGLIYTYEWSGFRVYDAVTMDRLYSNGFYCNDPKLRSDEENVYLACGTYVRKVEWNYALTTVNGKKESFQRGHAFENILYLPNAKKITSSAIGIAPVPVCGNGIVETGEICDNNTVQCTVLSSDYISGTATCNSTCSGYNQGGCEEDDGW